MVLNSWLFLADQRPKAKKHQADNSDNYDQRQTKQF